MLEQQLNEKIADFKGVGWEPQPYHLQSVADQHFSANAIYGQLASTIKGQERRLNTFAVIALFILLISLIAELLERSKVPRAYFWSMLVSVIAPILTAAIFVLFLGVEVGFSDF